jgi:hypothetical protein
MSSASVQRPKVGRSPGTPPLFDLADLNRIARLPGCLEAARLYAAVWFPQSALASRS